MTVEQLNVIVSANKADFDKKINEINKQLGNMNNNAASASSGMLGSFKALASGLAALGIGKFLSDCNSAYTVQMENELKLETIMKQRLKASDEEIQSIKDLASAQQELGVVGDEVQLAGAQQLATFASQKSTLETLIPAMNNLLVQQNGLNASASDATSIANMMGKVLQGETSALKRVGISFTEAEENALKYGNEEERAATLAKVITNNVGEMNEALRGTVQGEMTALANTWGDVKEEIGAAFQPFLQSVLPMLTEGLNAVKPVIMSIVNIITGLGNTAVKVLSLMGLTSEKSAESVGKSADVLQKENEEAKGAADGVDKVADSTNNLTDSVKRATAGFDEINKLSGGSSSTFASTVVSKEDVENAENYSAAIDNVKSELDNTSFDFGLTTIFDSIYSGIKGVWEWLTNDVFSFASDVFTVIFGDGDEKYKALQRLVEKIKALFGEDFISFWTDVGADINKIFNGTEEERYKALENLDSKFKEFFGEFGEDWSAFWQDIGKGFFELINGDLSSGLQTINDKFEALFGDLGKWWSQTFQGIGAGLYELSHSGEIDMIQLSSKYSTLYSDMMAQIVEDLRDGVSAAEALQNAKNKYLDTSEKLYFFNNDNNNIFTEENLKKWEDNVNNRSADLALSVDTPALPATPEAIDEFFRKIKGYASGGFPDYGDIFIANERGPEMVGTIGGRTAVVNNSQIETAIENAIARGFAKAGNGQPVEIHVYTELDGEIIGESVTEYQSNRTRRDNGYKK